MLTLNLQVPEARDRTAFATLRDGFNTVMTGSAVASAAPAIASSHANPSADPVRLWGHPPLGSYRLLNHRRASQDEMKEYGSHLLLFEAGTGQALEAESYGRLALLVYAGPAGRDRKLRRTQGGVRLTQKMLDAVIARLRSGDDMALELEPMGGSWWQFWKRPAATEPLSASEPPVLVPPADEMSLIAALMMTAVRRVRDESDDTYDRDRDYRRDRQDSVRSSDPPRGKGGEFGGAGATGGWGGRGAGPGVDHAGRVIAAGAAGAVAGAAAAAALGAPDSEGTGAGAEGPEASRFEPVPMDSGSGSGGGASAESPTTTTSTAY